MRLYAKALVKLARYVLDINASPELNEIALKTILKQELLKHQLSIADGQWGILASLYEKYNPNAEELKSIKANMLVQKETLLNAIRSKNAGVPTCISFLRNFEKAEEATEVHLALMQSFLIVKDFLSFEYFFQNKTESVLKSKYRDDLLALVKPYINQSKKPYQLYKIVKLCEDQELEELMLKKLPDTIKACNNLKEIFFLTYANINPKVRNMISKEKIEQAIDRNFSQAKFLEKEGIKQKALEIYSEILIYSQSEQWQQKAQTAIDTLAFE